MKFYTKQSFILSLLFLTFFVSQLKAQKLGAESNSYSSYAITSGGSLYTFGHNSYGQLGIDSTTDQWTPQKVTFPSGVTSWTAIAAGEDYSLAIGNDGNLYSWGDNYYGQLGIGTTTYQITPQKVTFPSGVTSWTAIAAGQDYSLAIGNDGNLYSWGYNYNGQLGIGTLQDQWTPHIVSFPSGVTSWTAIAGGYQHSLAIGNDGNLYSWGDNYYGDLGIGSTTHQSTPHIVSFPSGVTRWTAIAGGGNHSLAIGNNGNLYSWGLNIYGQLGIGSTTDQWTPQKVTFPSGVTSWTAIAAGDIHSLAIGNNGNLYSWGFNYNGQLGIGNNTTQPDTPYVVTKPGGVTSWTTIAAGTYHSLAIGNDGNFYSWGYNNYGQLGIGNTTDQYSPTVLNSLFSGRSLYPAIVLNSNPISFGTVVIHTPSLKTVTIKDTSITALSIDSIYTLTKSFAVNTTSGTVNKTDSLNVTVTFTPDTTGSFTDTLYIHNNSATTLVKIPLTGSSPMPVLTAGVPSILFSATAKGDSSVYSLKLYNYTINSLTVNSVSNNGSSFHSNLSLPVTITANDSLTIPVVFKPSSFGSFTDTLSVVSTGGNLKIPLTGSSPMPKAQKLGAESNSYSSYAITSGGSLYTFGYNGDGELGIGITSIEQNTPQIVSFPSGVTSWTAIAGGYRHCLAIGNNGNLYSWGWNFYGQLGIGTTQEQLTPQIVSFPSGVTSWIAIAAGGYHSLAIGNDGNLYSWGRNDLGELGIGSTTSGFLQPDTPYVVTKPSGVTSWTAIAAGSLHSLAIGSDGNIYSCGDNGFGALGIGSQIAQNTPQKVTFPSGVTSWTTIAAGEYHSLAIGNDGNLYSWGNNNDGQLGIGSTTLQTTPQKVTFPSGVTSWTAIAAGEYHSLAIGNDGNIYSWGYNSNGQLGVGYKTTQPGTPYVVTKPGGVTSWTAIAAGSSHSLAIDNNGNFYSWGYNVYGALGIGNTNDQYSPTVFMITGIENIKSKLPENFSLSQNYPNPFNPTTLIKYQLPKGANVSLIIYDITGREVMKLVDQQQNAGYYVANFNASRLASGVYFYRIVAGDFVSVKKMMLLK